MKNRGKISVGTDSICFMESRRKSDYKETERNIEKVTGSVWTDWNFVKAMEGAIE